MANEFSLLFNYSEPVNDALGVIMDYLTDQTPGRPMVTKSEALRYAVIVAAMSIQAEQKAQAG